MTDNENNIDGNVPAPIAPSEVECEQTESTPIEPSSSALPLPQTDGEVGRERIHVHDYVDADESMRGGFASVEGVPIRTTNRLLWIVVAVMSVIAVLSGVCSSLLTAHFMRNGERPPIISTMGEPLQSVAAVVSARKSMIVEIDCGGLKGSGVVMKLSDGVVYILTNAHVIEHAISDNVAVKRDVAVRFYGEDSFYKANVIGYTSYYDLAVVALSHDTAFTVYDLDGSEFFARDLEYSEGNSSVSIGNAMGMGVASYAGIISRASELLECDNLFGVSGKKCVPVIRTTAVINAGMSGGAMFDMQGRLIGVGVYRMSTSTGANLEGNNSSLDVEDTGFVIPVSVAYPIYKRILADNNGGNEVGLFNLSLSKSSDSYIGRIKFPLGFTAEYRGGKLTVTALDSVNPATSVHVGDEITAIGSYTVTTDICRTVGELLCYHVSGDGNALRLTLKRDGGTVNATFDKFRYAV